MATDDYTRGFEVCRAMAVKFIRDDEDRYDMADRLSDALQPAPAAGTAGTRIQLRHGKEFDAMTGVEPFTLMPKADADEALRLLRAVYAGNHDEETDGEIAAFLRDRTPGGITGKGGG